jgi:hypothetical protein
MRSQALSHTDAWVPLGPLDHTWTMQFEGSVEWSVNLATG